MKDGRCMNHHVRDEHGRFRVLLVRDAVGRIVVEDGLKRMAARKPKKRKASGKENLDGETATPKVEQVESRTPSQRKLELRRQLALRQSTGEGMCATPINGNVAANRSSLQHDVFGHVCVLPMRDCVGRIVVEDGLCRMMPTPQAQGTESPRKRRRKDKCGTSMASAGKSPKSAGKGHKPACGQKNDVMVVDGEVVDHDGQRLSPANLLMAFFTSASQEEDAKKSKGKTKRPHAKDSGARGQCDANESTDGVQTKKTKTAKVQGCEDLRVPCADGRSGAPIGLDGDAEGLLDCRGDVEGNETVSLGGVAAGVTLEVTKSDACEMAVLADDAPATGGSLDSGWSAIGGNGDADERGDGDGDGDPASDGKRDGALRRNPDSWDQLDLSLLGLEGVGDNRERGCGAEERSPALGEARSPALGWEGDDAQNDVHADAAAAADAAAVGVVGLLPLLFGWLLLHTKW